MNIDNIEKYYEIFDRVVDLFPVIKSALEHGDISHELEVFKKQELMFIQHLVKWKMIFAILLLQEKGFKKKKKKKKEKKNAYFSDKIISFIYSSDYTDLIYWSNLLKQIMLKVLLCQKFHRKL